MLDLLEINEMWRLLRAVKQRPRPFVAATACAAVSLTIPYHVNLFRPEPPADIDPMMMQIASSISKGTQRKPRPPTTGEIMSMSLLGSNVFVYCLWWVPSVRFQNFMAVSEIDYTPLYKYVQFEHYAHYWSITLFSIHTCRIILRRRMNK